MHDAGLPDIATGTVCPLLARLEREGQIHSRLAPSTSGPARKHYLPTDAGRHSLRGAVASWREVGAAVEAVLAATPHAHGGPATATPPPLRRLEGAGITSAPVLKEHDHA